MEVEDDEAEGLSCRAWGQATASGCEADGREEGVGEMEAASDEDGRRLGEDNGAPVGLLKRKHQSVHMNWGGSSIDSIDSIETGRQCNSATMTMEASTRSSTFICCLRGCRNMNS